jgi:hypothetical protein
VLPTYVSLCATAQTERIGVAPDLARKPPRRRLLSSTPTRPGLSEAGRVVVPLRIGGKDREVLPLGKPLGGVIPAMGLLEGPQHLCSPKE